jgi:hypothetical protein
MALIRVEDRYWAFNIAIQPAATGAIMSRRG